jgi:hypothetical protein
MDWQRPNRLIGLEIKNRLIYLVLSARTKSSYRLLEHCRKAARSSKWWFWRGVEFNNLILRLLNSTPLQTSLARLAVGDGAQNGT